MRAKGLQRIIHRTITGIRYQDNLNRNKNAKAQYLILEITVYDFLILKIDNA